MELKEKTNKQKKYFLESILVLILQQINSFLSRDLGEEQTCSWSVSWAIYQSIFCDPHMGSTKSFVLRTFVTCLKHSYTEGTD